MEIRKLTPTYKDYVWGGKKLFGMYGKGNPHGTTAESWEVSCHPDGESLLSDGRTLTQYIAENPDVLGSDRLSDEFPVLIKFIDAKQPLSLQVHPDDETARALENGVGKTEMWYVVQAESNAKIYCGVKNGVTKEDIKDAIENNTLEKKLKVHESRQGDAFFVEAGTVHAIGSGNLILEIQQNSNITYRLYDWGRRDKNGNSRELHVEKGLLSTKIKPYIKRSTPTVDGMRVLGISKYFKVSELLLSGEASFIRNNKSYTSLTLVSGSAELESMHLNAGESVFIPAGYGKWTLKGEATVIMTENSPRYFVGIDLGGTNIATAVVDENGKIYGRAKKKTNTPRPNEEIFDDIIECAYECVKNSGLDFSQIESVGLGAPGTIDKEKGTIEYANNLKIYHAPVVAYLEERLNKKVYIDNDANAAAWGEYVAGTGKNTKSMVMITLGTGVGGGIIENGRLVTGAWGGGAEIGHILLSMGGELCTCGRRGCFETYASATALINQTKKAMQEHPESKLWQVVNGDINAVNGKTPFLAEDDEVAKNVISTYLYYLAEGITDIKNLLQPEVIAIGGGISHEGEGILEPIIKQVYRDSYTRYSENQTKIVIASLKNDAGIIGAALLGV